MKMISIFNKLKKYKYYKVYKGENFKKIIYDNFNIVGRTPTADETLVNIFQWIKESFKASGDGGSSAYYRMGVGWKASYPETTGYLIPTLYEYADYTKNDEWRTLAKNAADWLLSIQSNAGGWQGLQVDEKCELRIFNSAMILDGLITTYKRENDVKYLEAAIKGAQWVITRIDENGLFSKNNFSNGGSFDTLVVACVLMVIQFMPEEEQKEHIPVLRKSLDALISLQMENGWFRKCNIESSYKDTALLHHLGYTLDGLIISSSLLNDDKYYDVAKRTAKELLSKFEVNLELPAFIKSNWETFYDINWKRASLCLTGYSQIAIVFQKISAKENDLRYLNAAYKINDIVGAIGNHKFKNKGLNFGLSGSYPIDGNYQEFQFVNWAAKYHAESVLLSINYRSNKK